MKQDYSKAHNLLPFLAKFIGDRSTFDAVSVDLIRDGSMRIRLKTMGLSLSLKWTEESQNSSWEKPVSSGFVSVQRPAEPGNNREKKSFEHALQHVSNRINRLLRGDPPQLLLFRNRNPQSILWSTRLFNNLCPNLVTRDETSYFDYIVSKLDQYEGYINVEFQSRQATVVLRLTLEDKPKEKSLISWGPISLVILKDERTKSQRRHIEHKVEEFFGYLISRNLPPRFTLQFEFDDPPAEYNPPDRDVDFIRVNRLDDSSFFEMMFATAREIAVVTSCDRECFNLFSLVSASKENWTTSTPWQMTPAPGYLSHCYNVNLSSDSTVMGSDNIERCLKTLGESSHPPELIIFFDSCLHRLIGEDIAGHLKHYNENNNIPLIYYDIRTTQHPYLKQLSDFWKNLFLEVSRENITAKPSNVCFLGLTPDPSGQISRILRDVGIITGASIFPHLPLEEMKEIRKNSLVVANDWEYVRIMFSEMLAELDRPVTRLPLPYGVEGTTLWIDSISKMLFNRSAELDDLPEYKVTLEQFYESIEQIKDIRIGIFARCRGVGIRLSSRMRFGVPIVKFLHELGLGIDLNLFTQPDDEPLNKSEIMQSVGLLEESGDSLSFFDHFSQIPAKIQNGDFSIVYSETYRDERIVSAGKSTLHPIQMSPGYKGAIQTIKVIQGLQKSSFNRRYRRFFSSPYAHHESSQ